MLSPNIVNNPPWSAKRNLTLARNFLVDDKITASHQTNDQTKDDDDDDDDDDEPYVSVNKPSSWSRKAC